MKVYICQATIVHHTKDAHCRSVDHTIQVPTFLLLVDQLGIVDEAHAEKIARNVVCPAADDFEYESVTVNVSCTLGDL